MFNVGGVVSSGFRPLVCVGGSTLVDYCWSILRVSAGMLSE